LTKGNIAEPTFWGKGRS